MVKRGGTKRKVEIKKIADKSSKAVTFSKRRDGLFSKAAQLCLLGDAQIAILATPSSSNSNVSFFSFGHSSVDSVVSAYLSGQKPVPVPEESREMREDIGICMARKELGLGYWWEDDNLESKSPKEIMEAMESMKILWKAVERLCEEEAVDFGQREGGSLVVVNENNENMTKSDVAEQTLMVDDDFQPASFNDVADQTLITTEDEQIISVSDSFCSKNIALPTTDAENNSEEWSDMDIDQILNSFDFDNKTAEEEEEDDHHQIEAENVKEWSDMDLQQLLNDVEKIVEEEDDDHQIVAVSENSCSNNALLLPAAAGGGLKNDEQEEALGFDVADLDLDNIFEGLSGDEFAASFLMSYDED
ncbi:hypothetical protein HA466_0313810 [Hirschfeldia incana]|nr:hypothetical protein HA466_0313810 [Hirschfeldia incana]